MVTVVRELINPEDTLSGRGLYLNTVTGLLFVGSKCCGHPLIRDVYPTTKSGGRDAYMCMKDSGDKILSYYDSSVDISVDPTVEDETNPWNLHNWAYSWTGVENIEVNITYM